MPIVCTEIGSFTDKAARNWIIPQKMSVSCLVYLCRYILGTTCKKGTFFTSMSITHLEHLTAIVWGWNIWFNQWPGSVGNCLLTICQPMKLTLEFLHCFLLWKFECWPFNRWWLVLFFFIKQIACHSFRFENFGCPFTKCLLLNWVKNSKFVGRIYTL